MLLNGIPHLSEDQKQLQKPFSLLANRGRITTKNLMEINGRNANKSKWRSTLFKLETK